MQTLALKLAATPLLIGAATLAGRRWGQAIGGWLVGLPLTSGPVAFFLALDHGTQFAARAAIGSLEGVAAQAAFCIAYGWSARFIGWVPALLAGSLAFAATGSALQALPLAPALLLAIVTGALLAALRIMPRASGGPAAIAPARWDLPARMAAATALVVALTGAAAFLGPQISGLLATFPLFASVLAVFAHRTLGAAAALAVLRGLLLGLFAFAAFFVTLGASIERLGIGPAFAAAIVVALAVQTASLLLARKSLRGA